MTAPGFPGGTSVTRLSVYPDECADGIAGGTPHLHAASTEAYVVVSGTGAVQTLDLSGFRETPLRAGSTVWFSPGVIHRAVNHGDLQVIVVMSNAGLPEAGDAVMTFPPEVVADPQRYQAAARAEDQDAVRQRRDLAVDGFRRLVTSLVAGDGEPLKTFYANATALVRPRIEAWREVWKSTVDTETRRTANVLDALERGDPAHLYDATVLESPQSEQTRWGMCGRLRTHDVRHPQRVS